MWRCPHCGTPQAETARCWVCHRSSTACGTCRHFRRSVAAQLGYCGLDRTRQPLTGTEIRGCWEAWPAGEAIPVAPLSIGPAQTRLRTPCARVRGSPFRGDHGRLGCRRSGHDTGRGGTGGGRTHRRTRLEPLGRPRALTQDGVGVGSGGGVGVGVAAWESAGASGPESGSAWAPGSVSALGSAWASARDPSRSCSRPACPSPRRRPARGSG